MNILFVHQNFPGQYVHLARALASSPKNRVVFITQRRDGSLPGVRKVVYRPVRRAGQKTHRYLRSTEDHVLNAQAVTRVALDLKKSGFIPDVMLGHNGWGEIWYLKDVFPNAPLIGYLEFFYRMAGADMGFDPEYPTTLDDAARLRTRNAGNLLGMEAVDLGICPTVWQKTGYPEYFQHKLHVIHEGIDTSVVAPDPGAVLHISGSGISLGCDDEVVTYVARNLEPYRGFPSFMRSLPAILKERPRAQVVIVGGDDVSYGMPLPAGETYKAKMIDELGQQLDPKRVHFLGCIPYAQYLKVLQISTVHVYLTYPFVLSWSMLEAMSAGCLIVASKTAPVEEVIRDGENGIFVDFFDHTQISNKVVAALSNKIIYRGLRNSARLTIEKKYDLQKVCLPSHMALIERLTLSASDGIVRAQ